MAMGLVPVQMITTVSLLLIMVLVLGLNRLPVQMLTMAMVRVLVHLVRMLATTGLDLVVMDLVCPRA